MASGWNLLILLQMPRQEGNTGNEGTKLITGWKMGVSFLPKVFSRLISVWGERDSWRYLGACLELFVLVCHRQGLKDHLLPIDKQVA